MNISNTIRFFIIAVFLFPAIKTVAEEIVATVPVGTMPNGIAVDSVLNKVFVTNSGNNSVTIIDGATNRTSTLNVGSSPRAIAINPVNHKIYVANTESGTVSVIDGLTNAIVATVAADTFPYAIAVNPATDKIYVGNCHGKNSTLTVIDGATNATETVGAEQSPDWSPDPLILAVNPQTDKTYFGCADTDFVTVLDGVSGKRENIRIRSLSSIKPGICDIGINTVTNRVYLACTDRSVRCIDGATNDTSTIMYKPSAVGWSTLIVNMVTNKVYVTMPLDGYQTNVMEIDGLTNDTTGVATFTGGCGPIAVNQANGRIYDLYGSGLTINTLSLKIIDGATHVMRSLPLSYTPTLLAINEATGFIYIVNPIEGNVSVITSTAPSAVALISPHGNAADVVLAPIFRWDSLSFSGSGYTVEVSDEGSFSRKIIDAVTAADSLLSPVSLRAGTKYYWRVAAANSNGTGPWAVDSFTTAIVIPSPPNMLSPANGARGIECIATLSWSRSYGAATYRVQWSVASSRGTFADTLLTDTILRVSMNPIETVYWRVNASNDFGISNWTALDSFFTAPLTPTLVFPADGNTNVAENIKLSWHGVEGADTYRVQITANAGIQPIFDSAVTDTFLPKTFSPNYTYTWRISAGNVVFGFSLWSAAYSFSTVLATPSVPVPAYPQIGGSTLPRKVSIIFTWSVCPGAAQYGVQLSTSPEFNPFIDTVVNAPMLVVNSLSLRTTYYWRVNAGNSAGTSEWSAINSFPTVVSGVRSPAPQLNALMYGGTLLIYSLNGTLVRKIPFSALETKTNILRTARKSFAQGAYCYCFTRNKKAVETGRFVVK